MQYETVLGYSKSSLIEKYSEKYFLKLCSQLGDIDGVNQGLKEYFFSLSASEQKDFLMHPDNASLLQCIHRGADSELIDHLSQELDILRSGDHQQLIMNRGKRITGTGIRITEVDNNPLSGTSAHPDHDDEGMIGWGERSESEWIEVFGKAFLELKEVNSEFYAELNTIIKKIIPYKTAVNVHNSASYKEAIGSLYLGYTIETDFPELNILEALIHESSHNKLNLVGQSEDILLNDYQEKFYSPYRPDARPVNGVLLGVHAIVPTVYVMLQLLIHKDRGIAWKEKVLLYHVKNKLGIQVLKRYAKFAPMGETVFQEICAVAKLCDVLIQSSPIFQEVSVKDVQDRAKQHFIQVQRNYLHLKY